MEFHQLQSFVAVAEEGSLTKAASRLFLSQPAVSEHVKALEEELGVPLFERTSRGMILTVEGKALFTQAEEILASRHKLLRTAGTLKRDAGGLLRIGLINEPPPARLRPLLDHLLQKHPGLRFEFLHGRSHTVVDALRRRDIDGGFFEGQETQPDIDAQFLRTVPLLLVGPAAWAKEMDLSDPKALETKPWSHVSPGCGYYRVGQAFAAEHGLTLDCRFLSDEESSSLQLALDGLAMAIVRKSQAEEGLKQGRLFAWPGFNQETRLCFGTLRERSGEPALRCLVEGVRETRSQL